MNIVYESAGGVINFNAESAAAMSLAEFSKHEAHHGLSDAQYKEVHEMAVKAIKDAKKNAPAPKIEIKASVVTDDKNIPVEVVPQVK